MCKCEDRRKDQICMKNVKPNSAKILKPFAFGLDEQIVWEWDGDESSLDGSGNLVMKEEEEEMAHLAAISAKDKKLIKTLYWPLAPSSQISYGSGYGGCGTNLI